MKKIIVPSDLRGKDLFKLLIENKSELIAQKKSLPKFTDTLCAPVTFVGKDGKLIEVKAADGAQPELPADNSGSVPVTVVGNAMWWCDSQLDVLTTDSAKRTIQQRKKFIKHLKDHTYQLEAQVGDVEDVYLQDVPLRKLGLDMPGKTQSILMDSIVQKSYSPRIYDMYRTGKIDQHSIGLNYVQIELAINDEEYEKEMDFWNKYYKNIINKDVPDEMGFFWVVNEIKLLEISAVLFGANELTPTLRIGKLDHSLEPVSNEAPEGDPVKNDFDVNVAVLTLDVKKFFNH